MDLCAACFKHVIATNAETQPLSNPYPKEITTMRRFRRTLVVTLATIGIAAGAVLGAATPAGAGFTVSPGTLSPDRPFWLKPGEQSEPVQQPSARALAATSASMISAGQ